MYSLLFFFQECNLENYLLFGICLRKRRYKQMGLRNIIFTVLWMTLDTQGSSGKVEYFLNIIFPLKIQFSRRFHQT